MSLFPWLHTLPCVPENIQNCRSNQKSRSVVYLYILHINNYRNRDIVLNTLIAEFITLCVKHHMAGKVPKSKDFYKVSLCSNTIVST